MEPGADRECKKSLAVNTVEARVEIRCTDRGCQVWTSVVAVAQIGTAALNVVDIDIEGSAADGKARCIRLGRLALLAARGGGDGTESRATW